MPGDHSWKNFDDKVKECDVCGDGEHEPTDHPYIPTMESSVLSIAGIRESDNPLAIGGIREHHNPLDIPFGKEQPTQEKNMNPKDVGGPDDVDEGGLGSGRNPEGGGKGGSQPGPLISFGINETIIKQLMDAKLKESCSCHKKN